MALLESDAAVRRAAHQRLRDALRQLTGTRSFHNFCPHFHDSSDGKSVRSVYRCRSVRETQTPFVAQSFVLKFEYLPRQARDKHSS